MDAFAQTHTSTTIAALIVRIVLTDAAIVIVPMDGRRRDVLTCPIEMIDCVEIVHGTGKERGISLTTHDGRRATFNGLQVDDAFPRQLASLGATVRNE